MGSLTIDEELMRAADIREGERVQLVDITNGNRLETYAITGEPGSGVIGVNGPPRTWSTPATWSS